MLVVPESVNPGWTARTADGAALTPVIVNGWQQGWVVPAGEPGTVTLSFPLQRHLPRRIDRGLCLLPLLLVMALVPCTTAGRRPLPATAVAPGLLGVAGSGRPAQSSPARPVGGLRRRAGRRYLLRHRQPACDGVTRSPCRPG